jgi:4-hydroxyproline epimerase
VDGSQTAGYGWNELEAAIAQLSATFAKVPAVLDNAQVARGVSSSRIVSVIDSHTLGEPTRWVLEAPALQGESAAERRADFDARFDGWRASVIDAPRGEESIVGVLVLRPSSPDALAQLIFFNNVGSLPMCVHGTIGIVRTLAAYCALPPGAYRFETPAGLVTARHDGSDAVEVDNVASYRVARELRVATESHGEVVGDVVWGGNTFFLMRDPKDRIAPQEFTRLEALAWDVRRSLERAGIRGENDVEVDHIHIGATPVAAGADDQCFVLCPGGAYDRSPCGTGTSAKVATLAEDGRLQEGETWTQRGAIGSDFQARFRRVDEVIYPTIRGRAHLCGHGCLIFESDDPLSSTSSEG